MVKRINYENQVHLVYVKEYANIIEDERTDRKTTNENENAWEALANKYEGANVTKRTRKHLEACWKNLRTRGPLVLYRSPECWGYVKISGYWGKNV